MAKIYADGSGYSFLRKESRYCVKTGKLIILMVSLDRWTNNEAEYRGILRALELSSERDEILTDSRLVWGQLTQNWKINYPHLIRLNSIASRMIREKKIKITLIPRQHNLAGLYLNKLND